MIETPESVLRKIQSLDDAWELLGRAYSFDLTVQSEIKAFRLWRDSVRSSLTASWFPSSLAPEYEQWQARYRLAYENARKRHPNVTAFAPPPDIVSGPLPQRSPWIWAAFAGSAAVGLLAVALLRK